jgi:hypothetical protein
MRATTSQLEAMIFVALLVEVPRDIIDGSGHSAVGARRGLRARCCSALSANAADIVSRDVEVAIGAAVVLPHPG